VFRSERERNKVSARTGADPTVVGYLQCQRCKML
jgi:hypothetical protein